MDIYLNYGLHNYLSYIFHDRSTQCQIVYVRVRGTTERSKIMRNVRVNPPCDKNTILGEQLNSLDTDTPWRWRGMVWKDRSGPLLSGERYFVLGQLTSARCIRVRNTDKETQIRVPEDVWVPFGLVSEFHLHANTISFTHIYR